MSQQACARPLTTGADVGTPKTLVDAIKLGAYSIEASEVRRSPELLSSIHAHVRDFIAQKLQVAFLKADRSSTAFNILVDLAKDLGVKS